MIGSVHIRVNAAQPNKPLCDMFAFQGSPSSIRIIDVPRSIGDWEITSVKLVVAYPNNMTIEKEAVLTGNVWVATVEGCSTCGKVEGGYEIIAGGVDENNNPVEGYVLGKGNVFVLENSIDVERLVSKFTVRYLKNLPDIPCAGDLVEFNGVMKLYDGHDWISMGGDVNDTTITIQKNGVEVGSFTTNASEATTIDIPVPSTTSELENDSGFITASAIPSTVSSFENDVGYITASAIPPIPSQTSDLVNDSGYITASAIPPIPSTTNDLLNDSGFITASAIPSQVSAFENDAGYITSSQVVPNSTHHGYADKALNAGLIMLYQNQASFTAYKYLYLNDAGPVVYEISYSPWSMTKYFENTFDPALSLQFGYIASVTVRRSGRPRLVPVNSWGWVSGNYVIKADTDDGITYATPTHIARITSTTVNWLEITLSSDLKSIETVGGETGQVVCTRESAARGAITHWLAYAENVPSTTSQLTNDSGFITASAIPSNVGAFTNDVGYLTASTMPPIPSQTSDLENNSGFITSAALSGYATENYVDGKVLALSSIYALDSDLDLVVASVSSIQTSLSTFATISYVDSQIGSINTILDNINGEVI